MYNGELFTLSNAPQKVQWLRSSAVLLNLKVNTNTDPLSSWSESKYKKKVLFHFFDNVQESISDIDIQLMESGKHIAICETLSLDDEITLIRLGFAAATDADTPAHNTLKMIDNVLKDNLYFSLNALSQYILTQQKRLLSANNVSLLKTITKKEKEVLSLVCSGLSNLEMAKQMNVSINTIKMHLQNIYKKTDCKSRSQLLVKYNKITL
jgi:DNA-binding NarL/FixJ family response regulator